MGGPTLRVEHLPHLGRQARRVTVSCSNKRTAMSMVPLQRLPFLEEGMPHFKAGVIYRHESECGRCDTGPLWRSEGLEAIRAMVDAAWDGMVGDALAELRN
jgi:hypothetical protein